MSFINVHNDKICFYEIVRQIGWWSFKEMIFQCHARIQVYRVTKILGVLEAQLIISTNMSFHFEILDSISSKLKPLVSGTTSNTNKSDNKAIAPKRRKRFSAPRNSCNISRTPYSITGEWKLWTMRHQLWKKWIDKSKSIPSMVRKQRSQWHLNQS